MVRCRGRSSLASMASNVGLLAPPPETTNSRNFPRRGSTKRRKASAIERAVNAVAVATTSALFARPQRLTNCCANSRPNSSRPAVLGGLRRKNGRRRNSDDNRLEYCARSCDAAVAIIGLAEEAIGDRVNHHVAGAGVESRNLFRGCSRRDCCQVRDAADVLHDAADLLVAIEQVIEEGNQRRAFASGGHVGGTEIGDDRDADARGDHGAFSGLPGDGQFAAQKFRRLALVIESLAVAADEFCFQAETALGGEYGFGVEFGQQKIQAGQVGYAGLLWRSWLAARLGGLFSGMGIRLGPGI